MPPTSSAARAVNTSRTRLPSIQDTVAEGPGEDEIDLEIAALAPDDDPPPRQNPSPARGKKPAAPREKAPASAAAAAEPSEPDALDLLDVPLVGPGDDAAGSTPRLKRRRLWLYALCSIVSAAVLVTNTAYLLDDAPYVWVAGPQEYYRDVPYRSLIDFDEHPHDVVALGIYLRRASEAEFNASGRDLSFFTACRAEAGSDCERAVVASTAPPVRKTLPLAIIHHPGKAVVMLLMPAFGVLLAYQRLALALGHALVELTAAFAFLALLAVFSVPETGELVGAMAATFFWFAVGSVHAMLAFSHSITKWYRLRRVYQVSVAVFSVQLAALALAEVVVGDDQDYRTSAVLAHMQFGAVVSFAVLHLFAAHVMVLMQR